MRVVLDTNIFIDAFFKNNADCNLILREEHNGEFQLLMSNKMQEELLRILDKSILEYELESNEVIPIFKILSRAMLRAEKVEPRKRFTKCEDPDDNMFFECAIEGNADYIISRDKHLHNLKNSDVILKNSSNKEIKILYPDEFVFEINKVKLVANFNNR